MYVCKVVMSCEWISFSATDLGTSLLSKEHIPGICLHPPSSSPPQPVPTDRPTNWGELECGAHDNVNAAVGMVSLHISYLTTDLTRTANRDSPPGEEMELQTHSSSGGEEVGLEGSEQQWVESDQGSVMQQGAESNLGDGVQQWAESDLGGGAQQGAGLSDPSPSARMEQGHTRDHKPRVIPDSKKTVV